MRKITILLPIFLFLLTGCSASYEIIIDDTVEEKLEFREQKSLIESFTSSEKYLDEALESVSKYSTYEKNTEISDTEIIGNGKKKYNSFDKFKKDSIIINEIFKDIEYSKNSSTTKIVMYATDDFEYFDESEFYTAFIDKLSIKIKTPGKIVSGNYDRVENNFYVWDFDATTKIKNIEIEYENNKDFTYIYVCLGLLSILLIYILVTYIKYKLDRRY